MNLYQLSLIVLLLACVLSVMVFVSYRKRLAEVAMQGDLSVSDLASQLQSTPVERYLGYGLLAAIAYLILQTIRQGFDFALIMIGASIFTGAVYLLDYWLTRNKRAQIIESTEKHTGVAISKSEKATLEPGLIENSRAFFPILLFVFLLRSFIVEPFQIPSGSMKPTLEVSDFILVNRFAYGIRMPVTNQVLVPINTPERGDVIVFKPPHQPNRNFIKRVVGLPGDLIQYDYARRILRVNGEVVEKELLERKSDSEGRYNLYSEVLGDRAHQIYNNVSQRPPRGSEWIPVAGVTVPEGKYFVLGDNRDNSEDARYWEGQRRTLQNDPNNLGNSAWGFVDENAILGEAFLIWMHWERFYPTFSRSGRIE